MQKEGEGETIEGTEGAREENGGGGQVKIKGEVGLKAR